MAEPGGDLPLSFTYYETATGCEAQANHERSKNLDMKTRGAALLSEE
jgi:hypothetical protein